MNRTVVAVALAGTTLGALPLAAHHGAATFDTLTEITMKGTVTEWIWANPHCFLRFDVAEEDGTTTTWAIETGNPADISNRGWARRSFTPGDEVTVTLQPARNGAPVGRARAVVLADGRRFE